MSDMNTVERLKYLIDLSCDPQVKENIAPDHLQHLTQLAIMQALVELLENMHTPNATKEPGVITSDSHARMGGMPLDLAHLQHGHPALTTRIDTTT